MQYTRKTYPKAVFQSLLVLLTLFAVAGASASPAADSTDSADRGAHILAAPYVVGNSDDGLTLGFGFGANRPPSLYAVSSIEYSLTGQLSAYVEGEVWLGEYRYAGKVSYSRGDFGIYPTLPVDPEAVAEADIERVDIKLAALRPLSPRFELGPAVWIESARGMRPEDPDKVPLELATLAPFRPGSLALGGVRARWRTTSSVRPMDGYILDLITQAGAAWADEWDDAKPDATVQFKAAMAKPLHPRLRYYLRAETRLQLNTPPIVRNYNGGEKKVRGQPKRREYGRRAIYTRAQTHWTMLDDWRWPSEVAHSLFSFIPVYDLDVELVPFYDMGVMADPDFGWLPARHGVGMGLHFVIPPELVLRVDVGVSPGGSPRFYFTIGESI